MTPCAAFASNYDPPPSLLVLPVISLILSPPSVYPSSGQNLHKKQRCTAWSRVHVCACRRDTCELWVYICLFVYKCEMCVCITVSVCQCVCVRACMHACVSCIHFSVSRTESFYKKLFYNKKMFPKLNIFIT